MTSPDTEFISILGAGANPEAPSRISSRSLPDVLPVLGLSDIVLFPGAVAPLLVETGPSIRLIDDVVAGDRLMGTVLQRRPEVADPAPEDLYPIGCVVRLAKMVKFPDNTARVLVEGLWRIHFKEYPSTTPYLCAKFELLRDETEDSIEVTAMMRNAQTQFHEIVKMSPALSEQVKIAALNTEDPGHFADLIAANLSLSLEDRQKLLETVSVKERLVKLLPMLNREHEVLALSSKIQSDVATSIAKTQRDFFLREQMRAIQRELGEAEPNAVEIRLLREKIEQTPMPAEVKKVATQELERLQQTPPAAAEYSVAPATISTGFSVCRGKQQPEDKLTWSKPSAFSMSNISDWRKSRIASSNFSPSSSAKKRSKVRSCVWSVHPVSARTSLGKSVADALGRKFAASPLGGMARRSRDSRHRRTYVGRVAGPASSRPCAGLKARNPVILLDELDKVGADFRGDPAAALLEVLDPAQNNTSLTTISICRSTCRAFYLSPTANWLEPIHPALRDRLEVIELPSYTESEKLRSQTLPRAAPAREHGFTRQEVLLPDATLRRLIHEYTARAGVRQLERSIAALARKAARKIVSHNGHLKPLKLEPGALKTYLGHCAVYFRDGGEKIANTASLPAWRGRQEAAKCSTSKSPECRAKEACC
jgi:ATP-dependent Lon protease